MHTQAQVAGEASMPVGPERLQVHLIGFEGPDDYARAGGVATRVTGLTRAFAESGFDTHLWFVGDPRLPGHETANGVRLHRWCQWISRHHRGGVYDGEEGKWRDLSASLPQFLVSEVLLPHVRRSGGTAVVIAEEWQTADAVVNLDRLLHQAGVRDQVMVFWNANNEFGFDRIDWSQLDRAAQLMAVSRYMRCRLWPYGVDSVVIPNGLADDAFHPPSRRALAELGRHFRDRLLLSKIARWDPDKRWLLAVEIVGELRRIGRRPLLVARGGLEAHEAEVLTHAARNGLRVTEVSSPTADDGQLITAISRCQPCDIVVMRSPLSGSAKQLLLRGSDAVLANSGREPFGLIGLEAMAVGGLACVGGTGEDYAVSGWNALVSQTSSAPAFVALLTRLLAEPREERAVRRRGRVTADRYRWKRVIRRDLLPHLAPLSA